MIVDLSKAEYPKDFSPDLIIIGGGAAGLTLAHQFSGSSFKILVVESGGLAESASTAALNEVEADAFSEIQIEKRAELHGATAPFWRHESQPFGVRYRGLGGSTQVWAGKSAVFDEIDFSPRPWIDQGGWPVGGSELEDFVERASAQLNLGPTVNDDRIWKYVGGHRERPQVPQGARWGKGLRSYFWQFSRSNANPMDVLRFGPELGQKLAPNVLIAINGTVSEIITRDGRFCAVKMCAPDGVHFEVEAAFVVLAASAIENARLLLNSKGVTEGSLGNESDQVGRYLTDHIGCRVATYSDPRTLSTISKTFGFLSLQAKGRSVMYTHGLSLTAEQQAADRLPNGALYFMEMRSADDPFSALKSILSKDVGNLHKDLIAILSGFSFLIKGAALRMLQHPKTPKVLVEAVANLAMRLNPNLVVAEFQYGGLPHKLDGISVEAIIEQTPDPNFRVTLSEARDRFGSRLPKVTWAIRTQDFQALKSIAQKLLESLEGAGLPLPILDPSILTDDPGEAGLTDMGHTSGTTRMSAHPEAGVVDGNCKLHTAEGVYIAGASVFPTGGHANPTLMICAFTIRLADHLKEVMSVRVATPDISRAASNTGGQRRLRPKSMPSKFPAEKLGRRPRRKIPSVLMSQVPAIVGAIGSDGVEPASS